MGGEHEDRTPSEGSKKTPTPNPPRPPTALAEICPRKDKNASPGEKKKTFGATDQKSIRGILMSPRNAEERVEASHVRGVPRTVVRILRAR